MHLNSEQFRYLLLRNQSIGLARTLEVFYLLGWLANKCTTCPPLICLLPNIETQINQYHVSIL